MANQTPDQFSIFQKRLKRHSYGLRSGTANGIYYVTNSQRHSFVLRRAIGGWECEPISNNDRAEAKLILSIATTKGEDDAE